MLRRIFYEAVAIDGWLVVPLKTDIELFRVEILTDTDVSYLPPDYFITVAESLEFGKVYAQRKKLQVQQIEQIFADTNLEDLSTKKRKGLKLQFMQHNS